MAKLKRWINISSTILAFVVMMLSCKTDNEVDEVNRGNVELILEGQIRKVTITVTADENITVETKNTFDVEESSAWTTIKAQAFSLIKAKEGYRIKSQWKHSNSDGDILSDNYVFARNTTIYAESEKLPDVSKQIKIIVKTEDKYITIKDTNPIIAEKGVTKWRDIQDEAKAKLRFEIGFELHSWRHGSVSGATVLNDDTFTSDVEEVFAVARKKIKTPGGSNPPGGGSNPPTQKEKHDVRFYLLEGRDLGSDGLNGISVKARNLTNNKEYDKAFVANTGDRIKFIVSLRDDTNVEEWRLNGDSIDYGTVSFTATVDGVMSVTVLVDRSQFICGENDTISDGKVIQDPYSKNKKEARVVANGTFVIPSTIGSHAIKKVTNIGKLSGAHYSTMYVHVADGIEELTAKILLPNTVYSGLIETRIRAVYLSNTLKIIGDRVFESVAKVVRYLVIPKSVKTIGSNSVSKSVERLKVGLSIYFEHDDVSDISGLNIDENWCNGLYSKTITNAPVRVYVKNDSLKQKLEGLGCKDTYKIEVKNFTSVPVEGDKFDDWQW